MSNPEGPRTLLIDIETFPMLFYAWEPYEARALRVVENTTVASFSAKWRGGKQVTRCIADYKGYRPRKRNDKKLLWDLWQLMDEADEVAAHGAKRFDVKKLNYRFILHGFGLPSPYKITDTLAEVKKLSAWDSHKLNELCRQLEIGEKVRTGGADLWFDCLAGDPGAWKHMKEYNARDVAPLLEGVYDELRPWIAGPNWGTYTGTACCPKCGSMKIQQRGKARTATRVYQRFQCRSCGGWSRSTESEGRASLVSA